MKKAYNTPLTVEVNVKTDGVMTSASETFGLLDSTVNTKDNGVQLGSKGRGEWGNLWSK